MPCRDYDDGEIYAQRAAEDQKTIDKLTRLLCFACGKLKGDQKELVEAIGAQTKEDRELVRWYVQHRLQDEKRIAAEKAEEDRKNKIKRAKAKLTQEEKVLLGVR